MAPDDIQLGGEEQQDLGQDDKSKGTGGMMVGAAIGFGIGLVFALGGFWAGIICIVFAAAGAVVGKILLEG